MRKMYLMACDKCRASIKTDELSHRERKCSCIGCGGNLEYPTSEVWEALQIRLAAAEGEMDRVREAAPSIATLLDDHQHLKDENAYLTWKLEQILPVFQEARDALPAISQTSARLRGISLSLADRMDGAGTANYETYRALYPPDKPATAQADSASDCEATCAECDRPINAKLDHFFADGIPTPFWVCASCLKQTNTDWEKDKQMLREQGIDTDKCTFIEDYLAKEAKD